MPPTVLPGTLPAGRLSVGYKPLGTSGRFLDRLALGLLMCTIRPKWRPDGGGSLTGSTPEATPGRERASELVAGAKGAFFGRREL